MKEYNALPSSSPTILHHKGSDDSNNSPKSYKVRVSAPSNNEGTLRAVPSYDLEKETWPSITVETRPNEFLPSSPENIFSPSDSKPLNQPPVDATKNFKPHYPIDNKLEAKQSFHLVRTDSKAKEKKLSLSGSSRGSMRHLKSKPPNVKQVLPGLLEVPSEKQSLSGDKSRRSSFFSLSPNHRLSIFKANIGSRSSEGALTFDAFVDKQKGLDQSFNVESDYPNYKIDKRLIFRGDVIEYPFFVIPYHSTLRKFWNLLIIAFIIFEVFWYPVAAVFLTGDKLSRGIIVFEIISIFVFLIDLLINMRTTYTNENNEEIVDPIMLKKAYLKSKQFILDVVTLIPFSEIFLIALVSSEDNHLVYSIFKLIRLLRLLKINTYLKNITIGSALQLLKTFIGFCIMTHWMSCIWYVIIKIQHFDTSETSRVWFPPNMRTIFDDPQDLFSFYDGLPSTDVYFFVILSVFMLMMGGDIVPVTSLQSFLAMVIGFIGAVALAYIFGSVTLMIGRMNAKESYYHQKLEELTKKLSINKIPKNLKIKVMEYFYYSWRKHQILEKTNDFSELSIPLQRDLAFYQYQGSIMKVPLFKELEPIEILSIIQKLKTCVYMPGDKIIREGERGTEMFFIQEGKVEITIKKPTTKPDGQTFQYEKIYLEKGSYFGEIALISNSKRTSDVNAYEFCILESFSKVDYENLKTEFPVIKLQDIGPRLKAGLKHYRNNHMNKLIQILAKMDIFEFFTQEDVDLLFKQCFCIAKLKTVADKYMEEIFVSPDRMIIKPKEKVNAIYVVLLGTVNCYPNKAATRTYLNNLKSSQNKSRLRGGIIEEEEESHDCVDDEILNMEKDQLTLNDQKKKLELIKTYSYGEYFGKLDFEINDTRCRDYYVSDSGCRLGTINQALLAKMVIEDPHLYMRLEKNVIEHPQLRDMLPLEEEEQEQEEQEIQAPQGPFLSPELRRKVTRARSIISNQSFNFNFATKEQLNRLEDKLEKLLELTNKQPEKVEKPEKPEKPIVKKIPKGKLPRINARKLNNRVSFQKSISSESINDVQKETDLGSFEPFIKDKVPTFGDKDENFEIAKKENFEIAKEENSQENIVTTDL